MEIAYNKIRINPLKPMIAPGFATNNIATMEVKGDLYLRYLRFKDDNQDVIYLVLDNLGVSYKIYQKFKTDLKALVNHNLEVIISCTHTHFAPSLTRLFGLADEDYDYYDYVLKQAKQLITETPFITGDFMIDYRHQSFTDVGQSRLSHKASNNVYSGVLSIYQDKKRLINFLFYNCHPTILEETPGYLTAEYPGLTIENLEAIYPDEFFVFIQGAAGDVSTRFTRTEKSFSEVKRLANLMSDQFNRLLKLPATKKPLAIGYQDYPLTLDYQVKKMQEIDTSQMSEKEIREINTGKNTLKKLSELLPYYPREIILTKLRLGKFTLVLSPFEMFSEYNEFINRENTLIVTYSQGYITYLTGPNNDVLTYEALMEMQTETDKTNIINILKND